MGSEYEVLTWVKTGRLDMVGNDIWEDERIYAGNSFGAALAFMDDARGRDVKCIKLVWRPE